MWAPLAKHMGVREVDMDFVIPNRANFPDILDHGDLFGEGPTPMCAKENKVLCGVDKPCSGSGCIYDSHYQWTGEECQAGDEGLPAACA